MDQELIKHMMAKTTPISGTLVGTLVPWHLNMTLATAHDCPILMTALRKPTKDMCDLAGNQEGLHDAWTLMHVHAYMPADVCMSNSYKTCICTDKDRFNPIQQQA